MNKKNWLAIVGLVAASLVGIPSAAHAASTINITMNCTSAGERNQYVTGGDTLIYSVPTGCTSMNMSWPQGTSYSLKTGGTVVASGTTTNFSGGPTLTLTSSNTYELTIVLPDPIPSAFVSGNMRPAGVSGAKSGTNTAWSGGMSRDTVYFVTDPSMWAGTLGSGGASSSSVPASLSALVKPTATLSGSSIVCSSGSWNYSAGTTTRSGSATTTYTYSLEQDGTVVASSAKAIEDKSYTFSNALVAGSTYSCLVEAKQYGTTGSSSSLTNVSKLASLKRAVADAKRSAHIAYFNDVRAARVIRATAVQMMTQDVITGRKTTKASRDALWAKIRAQYDDGVKAAKATEAAAHAAALKVLATAIADAKGGVIAGVK